MRKRHSFFFLFLSGMVLAGYATQKPYSNVAVSIDRTQQVVGTRGDTEAIIVPATVTLSWDDIPGFVVDHYEYRRSTDMVTWTTHTIEPEDVTTENGRSSYTVGVVVPGGREFFDKVVGIKNE